VASRLPQKAFNTSLHPLPICSPIKCPVRNIHIGLGYQVREGLQPETFRLTQRVRSSSAIDQIILTLVSIAARGGILTIFLLRTYAIFGQSKIVLLGLGLILVAIIALDSASLALPDVPQTDTALAILVCVYDTASTALTIFVSLRALRAGNRPMKDLQSTFHYLVLEQGVLYFCAISSFTIPAAVFQFVVGSAGILQKILNAFTLPFSGILAARFLLHLRAYNDRMTVISDNDGNLDPYHDSHVSTFQAIGRAIASTVDDFGQDPMSDHWRLTDDGGSEEGASNDIVDDTLVPAVFGIDPEIQMVRWEH